MSCNLDINLILYFLLLSHSSILFPSFSCLALKKNKIACNFIQRYSLLKILVHFPLILKKDIILETLSQFFNIYMHLTYIHVNSFFPTCKVVHTRLHKCKSNKVHKEKSLDLFAPKSGNFAWL